nr:MAG TPA: hypothetical protein [Bacteriophage sp.]
MQSFHPLSLRCLQQPTASKYYSSLAYFDRDLTSRRIIIPKKLFRRIYDGRNDEK